MKNATRHGQDDPVNHFEDPSKAEFEPEDEPLPPQAGTGTAGRVILATTAAALEMLLPESAAATAAGMAALDGWRERLKKREETRVSELLQSAANESSISAIEVLERLAGSDDLALLAAEAIDSARRSRLQGKASTLGRCLGAIIKDDAVIDEESIWIRIVSVVEPPHIRILGLFLENTGVTGIGSTLWGRISERPQRIQDVGEQLGLGDAVLPLVQDLVAAGLMASAGVPGVQAGVPDVYGQSIHATSLGAQLFARLSQAGLTSDG